MTEFEWVGDLDDCAHSTHGPFRLGIEDMADGWVADVVGPNGFRFHSGDAGLLPLTGSSARLLCELVVRAELYREREG